MLNSRSHRFSAASGRFKSKSLHAQRHTFSRSYGIILPSSFTRVLSSALVFSTCPPGLVWGTDSICSTFSDFSWKYGICVFVFVKTLLIISHYICRPDLPKRLATYLNLDDQRQATHSLLRHHFTHILKYWNINQLSIDYAFRLCLRFRLTLLRLASCRKPWTFGVRVSHPHYRYSCQHSHF